MRAHSHMLGGGGLCILVSSSESVHHQVALDDSWDANVGGVNIRIIIGPMPRRPYGGIAPAGQ